MDRIMYLKTVKRTDWSEFFLQSLESQEADPYLCGLALGIVSLANTLTLD